MLINILIRTSYRPEFFARCLNSVRVQTYQNIRILVSYDDDRALGYIPEGIETIKVSRNNELYFYDCYCNELKSHVFDGFFFFLDDDDMLHSVDTIEKLVPRLKADAANIVKLDRKGKLYPKINAIQVGQIGMPCMVLHHTHKNLADISGANRGDSYWILDVTKQLSTNYIDQVVVLSDRKGSGRMIKPFRPL